MDRRVSLGGETHRNKFEPSRIFNFDPGGIVYSRVEGLGSGSGMVGFAWNALREAFFGEQSDKLLLLTYETLTRDPRRALQTLYAFIGEPAFAHDFDARLGTPGLHGVARRHAEAAACAEALRRCRIRSGRIRFSPRHLPR